MDKRSRNEAWWEAEMEAMLAMARPLLQPQWPHGEIIVLKTARGNVYTVSIPDYQDPALRKSLEDQCIRSLVAAGDTEVCLCLATLNGVHPEIPSWHFRENLMRADPDNLETQVFLWGGGDVFHVKQFKALLPPNYIY